MYANDNPTVYVDPTGHAGEKASGQQKEMSVDEAMALYAQTPAGQAARQLPQNAPDPAVVEESNQSEPGVLSKLWSLMDSWGTGKKVGAATESMAREGLNANAMSDEAAERARAFSGSVPSGMNEEDIRNIAQGDRGAVRSGTAEAVGAFTAVGVAGAIEAAKQYGLKKATEVVAGAGTRLSRIFGRGSNAAKTEAAAASMEAKAVTAGAPAAPSTATIGRSAEDLLVRRLEAKGYTDIVQIQNKSGHGIDVAGRSPNGVVDFFEVKANSARMSKAQRSAGSFIRSRLEAATSGQGRWADIPKETRESAQGLLDSLEGGATYNAYKVKVQYPRGGAQGPPSFSVHDWKK